MKIVSWNVNSLRSAFRQGFLDWLAREKPDVVCLQEVRAQVAQLRPLEEQLAGYRAIWHPAQRPGYAGVAILTRYEPVEVELGLCGEADPEGRSLTVDFGLFRVGSYYAPNAIPGTAKILKKCLWLTQCRQHVEACSDKPFVLAGDFNVAHTELDSQWVRHPVGMNGCTEEEREAFILLMQAGRFSDPHREVNKGSLLSTWWPLPAEQRTRQNGIRYDYMLVSQPDRLKTTDAMIHHDVPGSDHCPVSLTVEVSTDALLAAESRGQTRLF